MAERNCAHSRDGQFANAVPPLPSYGHEEVPLRYAPLRVQLAAASEADGSEGEGDERKASRASAHDSRVERLAVISASRSALHERDRALTTRGPWSSPARLRLSSQRAGV